MLFAMVMTCRLFAGCLNLVLNITYACKPLTQFLEFHLFYQVFRHGDHTPQEFFPTDQHKDVARQQGYGQLTKLGIQQQYELGQYMRRRYSYFLSVVYKQCEIYVQSTDCDHTLMSAQASLAGLYPPAQGQIWNPRILWQPIPVHTVPLSHDNVSRN
uniref:acid phosphatase n=1 Tax=Athene cunicularia TaxID=194338 RepID=A0A663MFX6_ATHCN